MVVTIHQPEHLPWLGFFDKAIRADLFVILDYVQYRKNYFQNRNKIRTKEGWTWITLPVKSPVTVPVNDIKIDLGSPLRRRYINLISNYYRCAPFFDLHFGSIREIVLSANDKLAEINLVLIRFAFDALGIRTPIMVASKLDIPREKGGTNVNLSICKFLGASRYLSGVSGTHYLNHQLFSDSGIQVEFQEFSHPIYKQLYEPFIPCMSVIDLLFNYGPASLDVIRGIGVETMDHVFE